MRDRGATRVEIERVQSGVRTVLHGAAAEQVAGVIDPVAGDAPLPGSSPATAIRSPATEGRDS